MAWHDVADVAEFAARDVLGRECGGRKVAIYKVDDQYFATSDLCTHGSARLSEGEVVEGYIECPLHYGLFEICSGKAQGAPVTSDLRVYPLRVQGTRIEIRIEPEG